MKLASIAAALLLGGWLGQPALARPNDPVPAKPASVDGNSVAFAIILIGGLATVGRKVAADVLIRVGHGSRQAKVLSFPAPRLHCGLDEVSAAPSTFRVLSPRRPLIRVK